MDHVEEFKRKVFAVGLTDSVHIARSKGFEHVVKISKNWVCSDKPLDTPVLCPSGDIERVSAGHTVHEMSSSSCIDSLFRFIEDRYRSLRKEDLFFKDIVINCIIIYYTTHIHPIIPVNLNPS
ncbi:FAM172 family protein CG10038-like isoform X3 [Vespula maculifrons]|uniref:FAM172 family protein CG10038-like isoform X3 n=1 Tax=Vespula maculifrons TaxID=7453 RepID=A0ABD2CJC1_VESMC